MKKDTKFGYRVIITTARFGDEDAGQSKVARRLRCSRNHPISFMKRSEQLFLFRENWAIESRKNPGSSLVHFFPVAIVHQANEDISERKTHFALPQFAYLGSEYRQ